MTETKLLFFRLILEMSLFLGQMVIEGYNMNGLVILMNFFSMKMTDEGESPNPTRTRTLKSYIHFSHSKDYICKQYSVQAVLSAYL